MRFDTPLIEGRLVKRYKRFLADIALPDGRVETAHCPNPGAMTGVADPGSRVWVSRSDNPKRKLALTLEIVEADATLVGVNTSRPNAIAEEAVRAGAIPELARYARLRREARYGQSSRIDLLLEDDARPPCYVEVKNVHLMRRPGRAEFPDSVTARGAKHLRELADQVAQGARAVQLFIVQRADCEAVSLAADIDPTYAKTFADARAAGVEALALGCAVGVEGIVAARALPVIA